MPGLLDTPLAVVDLETTGAHPAWDRVTEIAVIEVDRGEVQGEWSTLVNPGAAIPPAIQALTGISNDMVAGAPSFARLAAGLHERLDGRVLVAHNARFDYGFLRHEFERAGLKYQARTLCTVKLSRRLYPDEPRHNLDSLIARHGIACRARHRALGDADAVWQFLRIAAAEHGDEVVQVAARQVARRPSLPAYLDRAEIESIPEAPGVYLLHGENGVLLYVGKSVAMRSRVLAHFADDIRSPREMQLAREVRHVEWRRTAGELGALLLEARLVKQLAPAFNRALRRPHELCGFVLEPQRGPERVLRLASADELDAGTVPELRGVFRSKRAALEALRGLADEHGLCLQTLGFEAGAPRARGRPRPCFRRQIGRCRGVCGGAERIEAHQARLAAALARLQAVSWPWRGPIGIAETDPLSGATEVHVLHHWCWLGTATGEAELAELAGAGRGARPGFDLDQYRILTRHLAKRAARVVELA